MVFLVAVPLSLGIAVASGAPLVAGLIAAVVGGVVAGALGGSALQVSGPAAGLSLVVAELVQAYGWRATCMITLLAGALQLAFGLLRVARAALAVSPAVVHGMLAGVGVVIALAQLHIVLGGSPQSSAVENLKGLPAQILDNHGHAVAVGVVSALAAIHSAGLVHRDLKPSNVMLTLSGCRVIDFGIARAQDAPGTRTAAGTVLGTPGWMAPEVLRGGQATPAADIFTWGCLVAYAAKAGTGASDLRNAYTDILWVLLNSSEFALNH